MPLEAYETLQLIRDQLRTMEFASLPAIVKTAQTLTKKVDSMTNYELANIISKDPFATAKVLDLANKGGSDKVSVTKLEDAILAAGYGKVRAIAMKLLDAERAMQYIRQPEQEEAASINLVSCLMAEELMNLQGNYEAAEAFICTVLRGYGKVLMSAFLIETYREAQILFPVKGETGAFRAAFGLTPVELTYELLSDTKLPKEILRTLKALDPVILEEELLTMNKTDELLIFSEFIYRLTQLVFNLRLNAHRFDEALKAQLDEFKLRLLFDIKQIYDVMMQVDGSLQQLEEKYDISPLPDCVIDTLNARINGEDPPKNFLGTQKTLSPEERAKRTPEQIIQSGINNIMSTCAKKDINVTKIQEAVVNTLMSALQLQECILFEKDDDEKKVEYIPVMGQGDMFKFVKKRTRLKPGPHDVFGIALEKGCDGLVFDVTKPNVKKLIPHWVTVDKVNTFFIYNFKDMNPPFIVAAMRRDGSTMQLPGGVMAALAKMRATAMKSRLPEPKEEDFRLDFKTFLGAVKEISEKQAK